MNELSAAERRWLTPPEEPERLVRCTECRDRVPEEDVTVFVGEDGRHMDVVCDDCLHDYLAARGADYRDDFIAQDEAMYYLGYWFFNLPEADRLAIVKAAYRAGERLEPEQFAGLPAEYCGDVGDDWDQYLLARLKGRRLDFAAAV